MKRSCVLFACTILSEERVRVLQDFLESFRKDFCDCDIYVGINPDSLPIVEHLIESSDLRVKGVARAPKELYTLSDTSAYQAAIKLVNQSNEHYEAYWFIHTKGGVNAHSDYLRKWYIDNLLSDRSAVEDFLAAHRYIGSYGMLGLAFDPQKAYREQDTDISLFQNNLTKELPYTHANFFYIHTLYVVKGEIVRSFLQLIQESWFESRLDRYYFEGIFPFVVSRLGYFPYIANSVDMNGQDLLSLNESWLQENNLPHSKYLHLYKTSFEFDQLNPPYPNLYANSYSQPQSS
jgi:hypothetical protein